MIDHRRIAWAQIPGRPFALNARERAMELRGE